MKGAIGVDDVAVAEPTEPGGAAVAADNSSEAASGLTAAPSPDATDTGAGKRSTKRKHGADRKALRQQRLMAVTAAWEAEVAALPPRGHLPPLAYRPTDYAEAYALTAADRAALSPDAVRNANVNAGKVLGLVATLVPMLDRLRSAFALLPVDVMLIDRIDTFLRSFAYSDAVARGALDPASADPWEPGSTRVLTPKQRLRSLFRRTVEARRSLNSDVRNLIIQGKVPKDARKNLKGGVGYYNAGRDVMTLITLLRDASPEVRAASSMTDEVLDHYAKVAYDFIHLSALIAERSENKLLAWDDRARAFTLLWNAYSQARRAVTHIVWDVMNVNDVLPSLMVGVGRKKGVKGG